MHNLTVPSGVEALIEAHPEISEALASRFADIAQRITLTAEAEGLKAGQLSRDQVDNVTSLFSCCPPEILVKRYGPKFAAFCAVGTSIIRFSERIRAFLSEDTDIKGELVEHASLSRWRLFKDIEIEAIQATYALLAEFATNGFDQDLFKEFLREDAERSGELSKKRLPEYRAELLHPPHNIGADGYDMTWGRQRQEDGRKYDIWHDGPMALGLMHNGNPQGIVGFTPLNVEELLIVQIQGVRPMAGDGLRGARGLARLSDWSGTMIKYLEICASSNGFRNIQIQSANDNGWIGKKDFTLARGLKIYDQKADDLEYKLKNGRWVKGL
jgi:hypothetical protein